MGPSAAGTWPPGRGVLGTDRGEDRSWRGGRRVHGLLSGRLPARVVGQLRLLTGDLASAEDTAQEAFVRAASRWRQLARYDQPEAWVRMTAFRLAIDLLRRARRQRGLVALLGARRERDAELHPQDRAVIEALLRLPLSLREVLVLHHCLDLPVDTVAAQTGVSVGTVKSRLSRGRERLAALLAPDPSPAAPSPAPDSEEERHARP
jgi:RNA polymerase sigma-70 factor, ECF subfamily